ncbi:MAG: DUF2182 domain-containing protein [Sphingomonadaceae bacterium]|nr:DUF2182 domain-containing protein [Sphingomonadaceae bacterium]
MTGAMAMPADPLGAPALIAAFVMWALMMVAMMLPSALPMILTHARLSRGAVPAGLFALCYVAVWTAASLVAALAQQSLVARGALGPMTLALGDRRIAGALLIAAGLYQLTPLKRRCLDNCRSPLAFLMRGWRPGIAGTLRLGLSHGLYCLGCCWLLMALLFAGGVMNLAWVALLAGIVLIEKVAPRGVPVAQAVGGLAIAAGVALIAGLGAV